MRDDRKDGQGVSDKAGDDKTRDDKARDTGSRDAPSEKDAVPEVEAEIVPDLSSPQGDLLKDDSPEGEASGKNGAIGHDGVGHDGAGEGANEGTNEVNGAKPRTPGVAIFAVFAACALAVLAYWLWQSRDGGAVAAPAPMDGADKPSVDEASADEAAIEDAAAAAEPGEQSSSATSAVSGQAAPTETEGGAFPESPSADRSEAAAEAHEAAEGGPDSENAALTDDATDLARAGPEEGGQGEAPEAPSSGLRKQDDALADAGADTPSTEGAPADGAVETGALPENPVSETAAELAVVENPAEDAAVDAAVAAAQAAFAEELDAVRNGFAREIDRLTADLGAEREKTAALQAEMTAMRAEFEEASRAREASAQATIASLRAELATARRALETPPEAAGEAARALARLGAAIEAGRAFEAELDAVAAFTNDENAHAPLRARAAEGAPTRRELKSRFSKAARAALAAASQGEAEGMIGNLEARLQHIISIRPAAPVPGDSPRAVMSRIEDAVRRDAYALALSEIDALPQSAQAALEDWADEARIYEEVRTALAALNGAVLAQAAR